MKCYHDYRKHIQWLFYPILKVQECQILLGNLNEEIENTTIRQSEHPDVANKTLQEQLDNKFGKAHTFPANSESLETLKECIELVQKLRSYINREKRTQIEVLPSEWISNVPAILILMERHFWSILIYLSCIISVWMRTCMYSWLSMYNTQRNYPVEIWVRICVYFPFACRRRRLTEAVLRRRPRNGGPASQQVWQDKYSSLLKGHSHRAHEPVVVTITKL